MKQGDLEPDLIIDIADPTGAADLNAVVSWRLVAKLRGATGLLLDEVLAPGAVVVDSEDASKAVVTRPWVAGETDAMGTLRGVVKAVWPDDRPQTFPTEAFWEVRITENLP